MSAPAAAQVPAPAPAAPALAPTARPRLQRGVRVKRDAVRGVPVLLAPERVIRLDPIGAAILAEVDGTRSFAEIVTALAARFDAPPARIEADAGRFLAALVARRMAEAPEDQA
ncbi:MAG: pyrroloquinoline quinone biosynthesis peptide chaperone PqqD [Pseudomonadota bacterium]|nr:pyrroloquinoline quinone biosynthesis peptide chaperone PqqD [Pseudomonadota bacterium]